MSIGNYFYVILNFPFPFRNGKNYLTLWLYKNPTNK